MFIADFLQELSQHKVLSCTIQGKARGKKKTLWLRLVMQKYLSQLGNFIQIHCGKIVFVGLVALFMSCLGLKTYQMESDINKLWIDGEPLIRRLVWCQWSHPLLRSPSLTFLSLAINLDCGFVLLQEGWVESVLWMLWCFFFLLEFICFRDLWWNICRNVFVNATWCKIHIYWSWDKCLNIICQNQITTTYDGNIFSRQSHGQGDEVHHGCFGSGWWRDKWGCHPSVWRRGSECFDDRKSPASSGCSQRSCFCQCVHVGHVRRFAYLCRTFDLWADVISYFFLLYFL